MAAVRAHPHDRFEVALGCQFGHKGSAKPPSRACYQRLRPAGFGPLRSLLRLAGTVGWVLAGVPVAGAPLRGDDGCASGTGAAAGLREFMGAV